MKIKKITRVLALGLSCVLLILSVCSCGKKEEEEPRGDFDFNTMDVYGGATSYADFSDVKLLLISLWDPDLDACVSNMNAMQRLYDLYGGSEFMPIGVIPSEYDQDTIQSLMSANNVTYPVLYYTDEFRDYVDTYSNSAFFVDAKGHVLSELFTGEKDYHSWELLFLEYYDIANTKK